MDDSILPKIALAKTTKETWNILNMTFGIRGSRHDGTTKTIEDDEINISIE